MKKTALIAILLLLALTSCSNAASINNQPTVIPISDYLLGNNPNIQPTPTPFQPILPTPTKTPIPEVMQPSATFQPTSLVPQFTPVVTNLETPGDQVRILILGSDYRPGRGFRTDVIMLLTLNPSAGTATLTSFPRDLYVSIPGVGMERINTAQAYGGFSLTAATFETNFGFSPDYYIMTNFDGFKGIIDTLGGIDVYAAATLTDECSVHSRVDGNGNCTIYAGANHMDGETALWYVRSRHSSSDFDRTRRAQEVIQAMFSKLMSLGAINHISELYSQFNSSVETNIPLSEMVSLAPLASQLFSDSSKIRRYAIGSSETYNYIVPGSGAMVLVPDQNAVMSIIWQALSE